MYLSSLDSSFQPKLNEVSQWSFNGNNQIYSIQVDLWLPHQWYHLHSNLESYYIWNTNWRSKLLELESTLRIKINTGQGVVWLYFTNPRTTRDFGGAGQVRYIWHGLLQVHWKSKGRITKIDLRSYIRHLRTVREQVGRYPAKVCIPSWENEKLCCAEQVLENMNRW